MKRMGVVAVAALVLSGCGIQPSGVYAAERCGIKEGEGVSHHDDFSLFELGPGGIAVADFACVLRALSRGEDAERAADAFDQTPRDGTGDAEVGGVTVSWMLQTNGNDFVYVWN